MRHHPLTLLATISLLGILLACPDEPFCQACLQEYGRLRCVACDEGYYNASKGHCDFDPNNLVPNCQNYSILKDKPACIFCKMGYMLDIDNNRCLKCEAENCARCTSPDFCIACFGNLKLDIESRTCIPNIKCRLDNCEVCISDFPPAICGMCTDGYALNLPLDTQCVPAPANCFIIDRGDGKKCRNCKPGYFIKSDGTCAQSKKTNSGTVELMSHLDDGSAV